MASKIRGPLCAHVAPFAAWMVLMAGLGEPAAWTYAVRAAGTAALLVWMRPWRWYGRLHWRHVPLSVGLGIVVFVLWVAGEWGAVAGTRAGQIYLTWGVMPWGALADRGRESPYAPAVCGWWLTLIRLAGSAFVIALAEEFFWRGFLYRWLQARNFLEVDPGRFDRLAFFSVALVFGFEHAEWLAGVLAGMIYGWLYLRTRDIWAPGIAHVTTNLLLGLYVLLTGAWQFW